MSDPHMTEMLVGEGAMTERWTFHGPANNIHVCLADDGNQRVCFLTSDGPTVERARLIAAAPEMLAALMEMLTDPPATLDEPDPDHEVIKKMRDIARAAIALATKPRP